MEKREEWTQDGRARENVARARGKMVKAHGASGTRSPQPERSFGYSMHLRLCEFWPASLCASMCQSVDLEEISIRLPDLLIVLSGYLLVRYFQRPSRPTDLYSTTRYPYCSIYHLLSHED